MREEVQREVAQFVDLHDRADVADVATVVGSGKDGDHLVLVMHDVSGHHRLVSSNQVSQRVVNWLIPRLEGFHPRCWDGSDHRMSQKSPSFAVKGSLLGKEGYEWDLLETIQRADIVYAF